MIGPRPSIGNTGCANTSPTWGEASVNRFGSDGSVVVVALLVGGAPTGAGVVVRGRTVVDGDGDLTVVTTDVVAGEVIVVDVGVGADVVVTALGVPVVGTDPHS